MDEAATASLTSAAVALLESLLGNTEAVEEIRSMARGASPTQISAFYRYVQSERGKLHLNLMKGHIDQILDS